MRVTTCKMKLYCIMPHPRTLENNSTMLIISHMIDVIHGDNKISKSEEVPSPPHVHPPPRDDGSPHTPGGTVAK